MRDALWILHIELFFLVGDGSPIMAEYIDGYKYYVQRFRCNSSDIDDFKKVVSREFNGVEFV